MKKQILILASTILLAGLNVFSQNQYCSTDERMREAFDNDPNYKQQYENFRAFAKKYTETQFQPNQKGVVYQIPVVFHVIHNYGAENISDAAILNTVQSMNDHWRKRLADSSQIQPPFNQIHDDMEIEFVLATKDPNGNCTDGITRHVSELTYSAGDNVKSLTKAKLNWPSNKYLNVWTVASIASGAGGYSYFPGISASIDGIVVLRQQLSALPHEAGHWLALPHPWGGTNDNNIPSNCNDDDGIDDTPNTQGQSSCGNLTRVTCTDDPVPFRDIQNNIIWPSANGQIHDNVQNIMDYAFCGPENFTQGQKAVVRAALLSSTGGRNNLSTASNLLATGADGSSCNPSPIVDFDLEYEYICTDFGNGVFNNTYNSSNISYQWTFANGTANSTTAKNPSVSWGTPGRYDVSLTATSAGGSESLTKNDLAKVISGVKVDPFTESFTSEIFPQYDVNDFSHDWFVDGLTSANTFARSTEAGSNGGSSLKLDIKNSPGTHRLISPLIDMTNASCDQITFDLAYIKRTAASSDRLKVRVSTTCGRTWSDANIMLELTASQMETGSASISGNYVPASADWVTKTVDLSKFDDDEIIIMFEVVTANGNTLFLDNVNIGCSSELPVLSVDEKAFTNFYLFPNPSSGDVNINFNSNVVNNTIFVTDVTGKMVASKEMKLLDGNVKTTLSNLTGTTLNKGVYFVTIENETSRKTQKLIVK